MLIHTYFNFLSRLYQKLLRFKKACFKQGKTLDFNHLNNEKRITCKIKNVVEKVLNEANNNIKTRHHK